MQYGHQPFTGWDGVGYTQLQEASFFSKKGKDAVARAGNCFSDKQSLGKKLFVWFLNFQSVAGQYVKEHNKMNH